MSDDQKKLNQLIELIGFYRGIVLDSCEQEMKDNPEGWSYLRSRLLKIFGHRGMEERVTQIMLGSFEGGDQ